MKTRKNFFFILDAFFHKFLIVAFLFLFLFLFSGVLLWAQDDDSFGSYDEHLLIYLEQAENLDSYDEWIAAAQQSKINVISHWEKSAGAISGDDFDFDESKIRLEEKLDSIIEERLSDWLLSSFFKELESPDLKEFYDGIKSQNDEYLYILDDDGNPVLDNVGDAILKKGEDLYDFIDENDEEQKGDISLWSEGVESVIDGIISTWSSTVSSTFNSIKTYVPDNLMTNFEEKYSSSLDSYQKIYKNQFNRLLSLEQQRFLNRRLNDQYSLRKKTEIQEAAEIARKNISETQKEISQNIDTILASLDTDASTLIVDGVEVDCNEWQEQFRIKFEEGLDKWDEAENELLLNRIQWEKEANISIEEGEAAWNDVFEELNTKRSEWFESYREQLEKGRIYWEEADQEMSIAIQQSLEDMNQIESSRQASLGNRVQNLTDMFFQSLDLMDTSLSSWEYLFTKNFSDKERAEFVRSGDINELREKTLIRYYQYLTDSGIYSSDNIKTHKEYIREAFSDNSIDIYSETYWEDFQKLYKDKSTAKDIFLFDLIENSNKLRAMDSDAITDLSSKHWTEDDSKSVLYQEERSFYHYAFGIWIPAVFMECYDKILRYRFDTLGSYRGNPPEEYFFYKSLDNDILDTENTIGMIKRVMGESSSYSYPLGVVPPSNWEDLLRTALDKYNSNVSDGTFQKINTTKTNSDEELVNKLMPLIITLSGNGFYNFFNNEEFNRNVDELTKASRKSSKNELMTINESYYWIEDVYRHYGKEAVDFQEELIETYGICIFDDPELISGFNEDNTDLNSQLEISELNSLSEKWRSVILDDSQVELLKAETLLSYWEEQKNVAQAVYDYSIDNSSSRPTEADTLDAFKSAQELYDEKLGVYNSLVEELRSVQSGMDQIQVNIKTLQVQLDSVRNELTSLENEYRELLGVLNIEEGDKYLKEELKDYYEKLLVFMGKSGDDSKSLYTQKENYFLALKKYNIESNQVSQVSYIKSLIYGETYNLGAQSNPVKTKTLQELKDSINSISQWFVVDVIDSSDDFESFISGLSVDGNSLYYSELSKIYEQLSKKNTDESEYSILGEDRQALFLKAALVKNDILQSYEQEVWERESILNILVGNTNTEAWLLSDLGISCDFEKSFDISEKLNDKKNEVQSLSIKNQIHDQKNMVEILLGHIQGDDNNGYSLEWVQDEDFSLFSEGELDNASLKEFLLRRFWEDRSTGNNISLYNNLVQYQSFLEWALENHDVHFTDENSLENACQDSDYGMLYQRFLSGELLFYTVDESNAFSYFFNDSISNSIKLNSASSIFKNLELYDPELKTLSRNKKLSEFIEIMSGEESGFELVSSQSGTSLLQFNDPGDIWEKKKDSFSTISDISDFFQELIIAENDLLTSLPSFIVESYQEYKDVLQNYIIIEFYNENRDYFSSQSFDNYQNSDNSFVELYDGLRQEYNSLYTQGNSTPDFLSSVYLGNIKIELDSDEENLVRDSFRTVFSLAIVEDYITNANITSDHWNDITYRYLEDNLSADYFSELGSEDFSAIAELAETQYNYLDSLVNGSDISIDNSFYEKGYWFNDLFNNSLEYRMSSLENYLYESDSLSLYILKNYLEEYDDKEQVFSGDLLDHCQDSLIYNDSFSREVDHSLNSYISILNITPEDWTDSLLLTDHLYISSLYNLLIANGDSVDINVFINDFNIENSELESKLRNLSSDWKDGLDQSLDQEELEKTFLKEAFGIKDHFSDYYTNYGLDFDIPVARFLYDQFKTFFAQYYDSDLQDTDDLFLSLFNSDNDDIEKSLEDDDFYKQMLSDLSSQYDSQSLIDIQDSEQKKWLLQVIYNDRIGSALNSSHREIINKDFYNTYIYKDNVDYNFAKNFLNLTNKYGFEEKKISSLIGSIDNSPLEDKELLQSLFSSVDDSLDAFLKESISVGLDSMYTNLIGQYGEGFTSYFLEELQFQGIDAYDSDRILSITGDDWRMKLSRSLYKDDSNAMEFFLKRGLVSGDLSHEDITDTYSEYQNDVKVFSTISKINQDYVPLLYSSKELFFKQHVDEYDLTKEQQLDVEYYFLQTDSGYTSIRGNDPFYIGQASNETLESALNSLREKLGYNDSGMSKGSILFSDLLEKYTTELNVVQDQIMSDYQESIVLNRLKDIKERDVNEEKNYRSFLLDDNYKTDNDVENDVEYAVSSTMSSEYSYDYLIYKDSDSVSLITLDETVDEESLFLADNSSFENIRIEAREQLSLKTTLLARACSLWLDDDIVTTDQSSLNNILDNVSQYLNNNDETLLMAEGEMNAQVSNTSEYNVTFYKKKYLECLKIIESFKSSITRTGRNIDTYNELKESEDSRTCQQLSDLNSEIEEIQERKAKLELFWQLLVDKNSVLTTNNLSVDQLLNEVKSHISTDLFNELSGLLLKNNDGEYISYKDLFDKYNELNDQTEDAYNESESAKYELKKAQSLYEYASTSYLNSSEISRDDIGSNVDPADNLAQVRINYTRAKASFKALETVLDNRFNDESLFTEEDEDFVELYDDYLKEYKRDLAVNKLRVIVQKSIGIQAQRTNDAYQAYLDAHGELVKGSPPEWTSENSSMNALYAGFNYANMSLDLFKDNDGRLFLGTSSVYDNNIYEKIPINEDNKDILAQYLGSGNISSDYQLQYKDFISYISDISNNESEILNKFIDSYTYEEYAVSPDKEEFLKEYMSYSQGFKKDGVDVILSYRDSFNSKGKAMALFGENFKTLHDNLTNEEKKYYDFFKIIAQGYLGGKNGDSILDLITKRRAKHVDQVILEEFNTYLTSANEDLRQNKKDQDYWGNIILQAGWWNPLALISAGIAEGVLAIKRAVLIANRDYLNEKFTKVTSDYNETKKLYDGYSKSITNCLIENNTKKENYQKELELLEKLNGGSDNNQDSNDFSTFKNLIDNSLDLYFKGDNEQIKDFKETLSSFSEVESFNEIITSDIFNRVSTNSKSSLSESLNGYASEVSTLLSEKENKLNAYIYGQDETSGFTSYSEGVNNFYKSQGEFLYSSISDDEWNTALDSLNDNDWEKELLSILETNNFENYKSYNTDLETCFESVGSNNRDYLMLLFEDRQKINDSYRNDLNKGVTDSLYTDRFNRNINIISQHNGLFSIKQSQARKVREAELNVKRMDYQRQYKRWESLMNTIMARGQMEWKDANLAVKREYQDWIKNTQTDFRDASAEWDLRYDTFISNKQKWIDETEEKCQNLGDWEILEEFGFSVQNALDESTIDTFAMDFSVLKPVKENLFNEYLNESFLAKLIETTSTLNQSNMIGNIKFSNLNRYSGDSFSTPELLQDIKDFQTEDRSEIERRMALIQYLKALDKAKAAKISLEKELEMSNEGIDNSLRHNLKNDGYTLIGDYWTRKYVYGATITNILYKTAQIKKYNPFQYDFNEYDNAIKLLESDISTLSLQDMNSYNLKKLKEDINSKYQEERLNVFGDRNDSSTYNIASNLINIERKELGDGKFEFKLYNEETRVRNIYENELDAQTGATPIGTEEYTEKVDEYDVDLIPGLFGLHIGYLPVFKDDDYDPDKEIKFNLIHSGRGELGRMMTLFIDYKYKEGAGEYQLSAPNYSRKWWDDTNLPFPALTTRSLVDTVNSVACAILTQVLGNICPAFKCLGMLNALDNLIFDGMDYASGNISAAEFGLATGQAHASAALSCASGIALGAASTAISSALSATQELVLNSVINFGANIASSISNNFIYSFEINEDGGLGFDSEQFTESSFGGDAMVGYFANMMGSLTSGMLDFSTMSVLDGLDGNFGKLASKFNAFAGSAVEAGIEYAALGETTINLANINGLMSLISQSVIDNSDGALSENGLLAAQGLGGASHGLLEMHLGKDGVNFAFGGAGHDFSINNLIQSAMGIRSHIENLKMAVANPEMTTQEMFAMQTLWSSGVGRSKELYDDLLSGEAQYSFSSDFDSNTFAQTIDNDGIRNIIINSDNKDNSFDLGVILAHEAMRNGLDDGSGQYAETENSVLAHMETANMIGQKFGFGVFGNSKFGQEAQLYNYVMMNGGDIENLKEYALSAYDSSQDYWKLITDENGAWGWAEDGSTEFDVSALSSEEQKALKDSGITITEGKISYKDMDADARLLLGIKLFSDAGQITKFAQGTNSFVNASEAWSNIRNSEFDISKNNSYYSGLENDMANALKDIVNSGLLVKNNPLDEVADNGKNLYKYQEGNRVLLSTLLGIDDNKGTTRFHKGIDGSLIDSEWGRVEDAEYATFKGDGSLELQLSKVEGLRAVLGFNHSQDGIDSENWFSKVAHLKKDSIDNFMNLFGKEGIIFNSSKGLSLTNVPYGAIYGREGQTGTSTTQNHSHAEVGYFDDIGNQVFVDPRLFYDDIPNNSLAESPYTYSNGYSKINTDYLEYYISKYGESAASLELRNIANGPLSNYMTQDVIDWRLNYLNNQTIKNIEMYNNANSYYIDYCNSIRNTH